MNDGKIFFKYVTARMAKIVLINEKLRWSHPKLFNDPFDVTKRVNNNYDDIDLIKELKYQILKIINEKNPNQIAYSRAAFIFDLLKNSNLTNEQVLYYLKTDTKIHSDLPNPIEEFQNTWNDILSTLRILCLSSEYNITSMWNHYCDSYRGVVIGLKSNRSSDSPWLVAKPVVYSDSPPPLSTKEGFVHSYLYEEKQPTPQDFFDQFLCYKTTDWAYEKEWRIVSWARPGEVGDYSDYSFNINDIERIYFGPLISDHDRNDILAICNMRIKHASIYHGRFMDERKIGFDEIGNRNDAI